MSSRVVLFGIFVVFSLMIVLYSYLANGIVAGVTAADRHADRRILFRDCIGLSGGRHRVVEQSDFRARRSPP